MQEKREREDKGEDDQKKEEKENHITISQLKKKKLQENSVDPKKGREGEWK